MSSSEWIGITGLAAGIMATVIGSVWNLSYKIGTLASKVDLMEKTLANVVTTVTQMRIEMTEMQVKLDVLWRVHMSKSHSPISLNETGAEILSKSNIGAFANSHYDEILRQVRTFTPDNAYQTQEILISIVGRYKKTDQHKLKLQEIAFSSGYDIDSLLFVAALSIRDRIVKDMGFANENSNNILL